MQNRTDPELRSANDAIASNFNATDFFCAEVRERLGERLNLFSFEPAVIADLGASTGLATPLLKQRFPDAEVIEIDFSEQMLRQPGPAGRTCLCADVHRLPLAEASVDMVFSNLLLPASPDPERLFDEVRRVLRHPGLFLFSTLGPDTLKEVRKAWRKVDRFAHVHEFADMHNIGDALVKAGFADPVLDVELLTINYSNIARLVRDLRATAGTNRQPERPRGLVTQQRWERFADGLVRDEQQRIPISFEIVCGQAWSGVPASGVKMTDGEARFPVSSLLKNQR
jgi:malonyl-CoA O-methyltransferase